MDPLHLCFHSRCSLCRFELVVGENVAAVTDEGSISKEFRFGQRKIWDESLSITFIHCRGRCQHRDGRASVCHTKCIKFAADKSSTFPTKRFGALAYISEPLAAVEQQRSQWIQSSLQSVFISGLKLATRPLPPELAFMVAQYCTCEYAIAAVWVPTAEPKTFSIEMPHDIWARYVMIDGVRYLASVSNESSSDARLVLSTTAAADVDRMYIAEDHVGIRQVYFGNTTPPGTDRGVPGLWWRSFTLQSNAKIWAYHDGLKVRRFGHTSSDEVSHLSETTAWLVPAARLNLRFDSFFPKSPTQLRMTSLNCNNPRTTAYSACWGFGSLRYIHTHNAGDSGENLALYNDVVSRNQNAVWLYMPRDEGEYVSHIWKRYGRLTRELALLVVTNRGRVMTLGFQPRRSWRQCDWTLLYRSDGSPSCIFFDFSPHGIHKLAFESPEPISDGQFPVIPMPLSPYPESDSTVNYFYTFAVLQNTVKITPCESKVAGKRSIIGLLFHYSDGTQACVGQFRPDRAATHLVVGSSPNLWLSFDTEDGYPFVDGVGVSPPPEPKSQKCLYVSWYGKLEWWFSDRQCKLYYEDQFSVPTKS
ncbi:hypothetical protein F4678DRAFT_416920 [Xylaria arbuscula]|nr:hypothetical protein F4678DRAFT_416920 [Xylaria arbuscula]